MASQVPDDTQSSGGHKNSTTPLNPPEQGLKCPRCDSTNTKFCYYNNYSLTQPRHFCKSCRRYWTKGGTLRSVPIGGGCRKNKKTKSSSSSSPSLSRSAVEFQMGDLHYSRLHPSTDSGVFSNNQLISFGDLSSLATISPLAGASATSLVGFDHPIYGENIGGSSSTAIAHAESSIASSIECLSSINQDLHWKLQKKRLGMLFGGEIHEENSTVVAPLTDLMENQHQPISCEGLESSKDEVSVSISSKKGCVGNSNPNTEWFFDNFHTTPNIANNSNNNSSSNSNLSNWNGNATWAYMHQFTTLP